MKASSDQINRSVEIFQALAHHLRLQICVLLAEESISVSTICQRLDAPQHRVSQQLALLRSAGLVLAEKQSRQVFYSIKDEVVRQVIAQIFKSEPPPQHQDNAAPEKQQKRSSRSFEAGRFSEIR